MDEILMNALRNGWRLGPGTVVERQGPPYRPARVARLGGVLRWLKPKRR